MNRVTLQRVESGDEGTFGLLSFGALTLHSGELPWRDNRVGVSCIPTGVYTCTWRKSPRFGLCYHVEDVPGRTDILIHAGNYCGDEALGWSSDVNGCIILGRARGVLTNDAGNMQHCVTVSRLAVGDLADAMDRQPFELEILEIA